MNKYLLLYRSSVSAEDQMAAATPEQAQAGIDAWMAWGGRAGSAVTDMGSPTQLVATVGEGTADTGFVGGYALMDAETTEALIALLDGHPHLMMPGNTIEVLQLLAMPGGGEG
jgi:hypothetical protein